MKSKSKLAQDLPIEPSQQKLSRIPRTDLIAASGVPAEVAARVLALPLERRPYSIPSFTAS
jgi:hypothetical protein